MTHIFFVDKKAAYCQLGCVGMAPEVFSMRNGRLWENVFAMNEGRAVRPEVAVEPEVAILAMGYDNENDVIARRG
jgi:hypothetical protein